MTENIAQEALALAARIDKNHRGHSCVDGNAAAVIRGLVAGLTKAGLSGDGTPVTPAAEVAALVQAERERQDAKWGEQNHPDGTAPTLRPFRAIDPFVSGPVSQALAANLATSATTATNVRAARGDVTWRDILLEEVFEVLAEEDPEKLITELVQVAAVAQQWVEAIARREEADSEPKRAVQDHPFVGVAGHADDDECTVRADGTDASYCGLPEHDHEESTR